MTTDELAARFRTVLDVCFLDTTEAMIRIALTAAEAAALLLVLDNQQAGTWYGENCPAWDKKIAAIIEKIKKGIKV